MPYAADNWAAWYDACRVDNFSGAGVIVAHCGAVRLFHLFAAFAWQMKMRALATAFANAIPSKRKK